ncbi:hypothetical protein B0H16DRAFT_1605540 [Mycena metata]|uniref:Signal recognition particle subunit SRP72 n=1 Tax=Mycena metata TaxID=1033252 RepID=A0AAD7HGG1_9AGAR|nr:hypothetical protein B0H16DRAFT_1605540 [Mycena metata]
MPVPPSKAPRGAKSTTHGPKPKTRVPPTVPEQLKRLFTTLCKQIDGGHHPNAIKTCDKILRLAPADPDALQTKLFLLLTVGQPTAAISLIESLNAGEGAKGPQYVFERAYALYCLHKRGEAREALAQNAGVDERGARHLEAQLNYREGAYHASFDIYNELLDSAPTAEEHADILTNITAASAHLDFINTGFLRALDALAAGVRAGVEEAPPPAPVASTSTPGASTSATEAKGKENAELPPATKKRKPRLPPGVIPGVTPPPDPERWLKKSERSNVYSKRRKGGGGGASQGSGGASQGAAVDVETGKGGISGGGTGGGSKAKGKKRK